MNKSYFHLSELFDIDHPDKINNIVKGKKIDLYVKDRYNSSDDEHFILIEKITIKNIEFPQDIKDIVKIIKSDKSGIVLNYIDEDNKDKKLVYGTKFGLKEPYYNTRDMYYSVSDENTGYGMRMIGDNERGGGAKSIIVANQCQSENPKDELSKNAEKQNQNPKNKVFYLPNKILYKSNQ